MKILRGLHTRLRRMPQGVTISGDPGKRVWRHPWSIATTWAADPGEWRIRLRPGLVNGHVATITMRDRDAKTRLPDPAQAGKLPPLPVELSDDFPPHLVAAWRNPQASAGLTATLSGELVELPGEGFPKFFDRLGVKPAARGSRVLDDAVPDPTRTRQIRACDIFLSTPRIASVQSIDIGAVGATSQSVTISTTYNATRASQAANRYRLLAVPRWIPPQEPTALDRLFGTAVEPQTDECLIATLWIVSPPDAPDLAIPDGTWQPIPQYHTFWNLAHAARRPVLAVPNDPLRLDVPLALGTGQSLVNALLDPINQQFNQISQYLEKSSTKGEFWTV